MRRNWITGIVLTGVAYTYYRLADALPQSLLSDEVGADGFPKLLAISLAAFSILLTLTGVFEKPPVTSPESTKKAAEDRYRFLRAGGAVLIGAVYLLIISWAGYPLAVGLLMVAVILYNGEPFSLKVLITAIIAAVFFWIFFALLLKVPMPAGIWPKLFSLRG